MSSLDFEIACSKMLFFQRMHTRRQFPGGRPSRKLTREYIYRGFSDDDDNNNNNNNNNADM